MVLKKDKTTQQKFQNNGSVEKLTRNSSTASSIIKSWAECSSCHGIPNIARHHSLLIKWIWTICFLTSFFYCCYTLRKATLDYMSFEVNSQITIQRLPSIEFPTVTLCNKEYINFAKHGDLKLVIDQVMGTIEQSLIYNLSTLDIVNYMDYSIRYFGYAANLTDRQRAYYCYSLDDMLISCRFNNINCDNSSFRFMFSETMGNCFQFNSKSELNGAVLKTSTPGRRNALRLELNIGTASPLNGMVKSRGMTIYVHNSSYLPMTDVEGVSLSPGFETDIVVKQSFLNKQPSPYNTCTPSGSPVESSLGRSTTKLFGQYNQKYCLQVCLQNYTVSRCGCYDLTLPSLAPWPACNTSLLISCIYPLYDEFYSGPHLACFDQCPDECSNVLFSYELSTSDFPTQFYASLLQKMQLVRPTSARQFQNLDEMKDNILAFNVFYDDISYIVIDEVPAKTLEQFVADIGGLIGLCIGTSLLSLVELLELTLLLIFSLFEKRNHRIKE